MWSGHCWGEGWHQPHLHPQPAVGPWGGPRTSSVSPLRDYWASEWESMFKQGPWGICVPPGVCQIQYFRASAFSGETPVQFSSVAQSCPILCDPMDCNIPGLPVHHLLKLMSFESVMPSNRLILCRPLLPPSIFPRVRVFSNESVLCMRWPKYWSFSVSPSKEY